MCAAKRQENYSQIIDNEIGKIKKNVDNQFESMSLCLGEFLTDVAEWAKTKVVQNCANQNPDKEEKINPYKEENMNPQKEEKINPYNEEKKNYCYCRPVSDQLSAGAELGSAAISELPSGLETAGAVVESPKFCIIRDLRHYKPKEIEVHIASDIINIQAKHLENGEHTCELYEQIKIPKGVESSNVKPKLNEQGILIIEMLETD